MPTLTLLSSAVFQYTGSGALLSGSVRIQAWGAGGHGAASGVGGSGGAYAEGTFLLNSASYSASIGIAGSANLNTWIVSGSGGAVIVRAPGGSSLGTVTHQPALFSGSITYVGGQGGADFVGYASNNGSGGGAAAGSTAIGADGASGYYASREAGASGGAGVNGAGSGGTGSFYNAGAGNNRIYSAGAGTVPGGGGGGNFDSQGADVSAEGANGMIILTY